MFDQVCVFDSVGSESSSSEKLDGLRPPVDENGKSVGSVVPTAGWASLTATSVPRLLFVNVQVVVSFALRTIAVTGLPSLHVAEARSQPATPATSATE